jgi:hypothetical protein
MKSGVLVFVVAACSFLTSGCFFLHCMRKDGRNS